MNYGVNTMNKNGKLRDTLFIEKFETAKASGKTLQELDINQEVFLAYKESREAWNNFINFYDLIDEKDAEDITNCCRGNNIKEFTISSNSTGMIRSIMALEAQGCRLIGTLMINRDNPLFDDAQIPAIKMEIL